MNINKQIDALARCIQGDPALMNGFIILQPNYHQELYRERSISLAELDNVNVVNTTFKRNFEGLEQLVLFGSVKDTNIHPYWSAWFGGFIGNDEDEHPMEDRAEYKLNLFGLKTLNS